MDDEWWLPVEEHIWTVESDYDHRYPLFMQPYGSDLTSVVLPSNSADINILPANDYYGALPPMTPAYSGLGVDLVTRPDANDLQLNNVRERYKQRQSENTHYLSSTDHTPVGNVSVSGYQQVQNTTLVAPPTYSSDHVVPLDIQHANAFHAHGWSSTGYLPSVSAENGHQRAPGGTSSFNFSSSHARLYAPPSYDVATPTLPADGTTLCRRGPDIRGIEKRREKDASFFCTVNGCNSVGFTARGSLNRHVKDKHSGKQHLCSMCSHAFADSTSVGRHERDRHQRAYNPRPKKDI